MTGCRSKCQERGWAPGAGEGGRQTRSGSTVQPRPPARALACVKQNEAR